MTVVFAIAIFLLAAGGLAAGLALTGRPPETACGNGRACAGGGQCATCPNRASSTGETTGAAADD